MPLYVFRHAESTANQAGIIVSDPVQGVNGHGLTERGRAQVASAPLPFPPGTPVRLISSDFLRARESAALLAARLGAPEPELSALLRERDFAAFEGQDKRHYEKVWRHDAAGTDLAGVESVESVVSRLGRFLSGLRSSAVLSATGGEHIILVSHGDILQILLAWSLGLPPRHHRSVAHLENAECRILPELPGLKP